MKLSFKPAQTWVAPSLSQTWEAHLGKNAYTGVGATNMEGNSAEEWDAAAFSRPPTDVAYAKMACDQDPQCHGFTHDPVKNCYWKLVDINPKEFRTGRFNVYVKASVAEQQEEELSYQAAKQRAFMAKNLPAHKRLAAQEALSEHMTERRTKMAVPVDSVCSMSQEVARALQGGSRKSEDVLRAEAQAALETLRMSRKAQDVEKEKASEPTGAFEAGKTASKSGVGPVAKKVAKAKASPLASLFGDDEPKKESSLLTELKEKAAAREAAKAQEQQTQPKGGRSRSRSQNDKSKGNSRRSRSRSL